MVNFGYKLNTDRQIDYDKNDAKICEQIEMNEPSFCLCISCGTCSATCSAALHTDFSIRKLITLIKRHEYSEAKTEIYKCMLCGKCQLACPRGVNTRNLILNIRRSLLSIN